MNRNTRRAHPVRSPAALAAMLAALFLGSGARAEEVAFATETGPLKIERGEIPQMYKDEVLNNEYLGFLARAFPAGIPKDPVPVERQPFLYRYCAALFEQRDFGQALRCLDAVRDSVAAHGDPRPIGVKAFSWALAALGMKTQAPGAEYPLAVREPMLRAEIHMELGEISQSAKFAGLAIQRWKAIDASKLPPPMSMAGEIPVLPRTLCESSAVWGPFSCGQRLGGDIDMTAFAAVAFILNDDAKQAEELVAYLEKTADSFILKLASKQFWARTRAALVRIHMARKDYASALKIADDESHFLVDVVNIGWFLFTFSKGSTSGGDMLFRTLQSQHTLLTRFQVAHARVEVGRLADAKAYLDEILGKEELKALAGIYWAALYDRGRIAEGEGKADEAIALYQTAVDEIERQRSTINTENAKIGFFGDKQAVYQALVRLLFQSGRHEDAFLVGERSKSRALVDMLAGKQDFHLGSSQTDKVRLLLAKAQATEVALARDTTVDGEVVERIRRALPDTAGSQPGDAGKILAEARNFKLEARVALADQAPELSSLVTVSKIALAEIQGALPADQALVSYYHDAAQLYAFIIDADGLQAVKLRREGLEEEIQAFRQAIAGRNEGYAVAAKSLHLRLIAPLAGAIRHQRLLIAGHGALHYLPFAALHDGEHFLLDRYELSFLPSASTLKFIGRIDASGKPGTVLAFGNPDLGDPRYDLAFAEREAREVSALFPDSALFVRRDASKRSLLEFGTGFRYLHFATHGKFDAANPLGSALLLATDSAGNERDRLTIGELYSMRLDADLVTLSACETGLGKVANGDDVVGLVRGFLYAGANQIVSTLWEIDDEATSSLMTDFYAKLKAGTNKTRALREAQLAARAKYPHPAYWAAFQITGEPARRAATPAPGAKRRTN
ncbi:MAG: CHAT domain-containing protein [Sulfuritalea sp.]|nr:CHAT domain-containing protein [Sulfuritalea sp.]